MFVRGVGWVSVCNGFCFAVFVVVGGWTVATEYSLPLYIYDMLQLLALFVLDLVPFTQNLISLLQHLSPFPSVPQTSEHDSNPPVTQPGSRTPDFARQRH